MLADFQQVRDRREERRAPLASRTHSHREADLPCSPILIICGVDGSYVIDAPAPNGYGTA